MLSFKPDNREPIFFLGAGAEVFYYWLITAPSKAVKANDENNLSQEMEPEGFQTSATLGIGLVGQGLLVRAIWLRWLLSFCVHLPSGTLSRLWHNKKMFLPKVLAATCTSFYMLQYHLSDECVGVPVAAVPAAEQGGLLPQEADREWGDPDLLQPPPPLLYRCADRKLQI